MQTKDTILGLTKAKQLAFAIAIVRENFGEILDHRMTKEVSLAPLCRRAGVVVDPKPRPLAVDGYLCVYHGQLTMRLRTGTRQERRRFTMAHELGHILLCKRTGEEIRDRCRFRDHSDDEERLVDTIAAEILMPTKEVLPYFNYCEDSGYWDTIRQITDRFQISVTAAINKLLCLPQLVAVSGRANQTTSESMLLRFSNSIVVRRVQSNHDIWRQLCWDPHDGNRCQIEIQHRENGSNWQAPSSLPCELKIMHRIEDRKYWMLGWIHKDSD